MSTNGDTLHRQIKAKLIESFQDWSLGRRLPSIRALSDEHGVAYLTINGILKELEWEGYIKGVPRKGMFLASRERTVEKDLATGTARLKSIVFAYPNYFSYATWIRQHLAEERAVKQGLALLEFKMTPETNYDGLLELVERRDDVLGVICIPIPGSLSPHVMDKFDDIGVPVAILSHCESVEQTARLWSIPTDWRRAGYLMADELLSAGHRRLSFIQHEPKATERQKPLLIGVLEAMRKKGIPSSDLQVVAGETRPWDDSRIVGYELTRQVLAAASSTAALYESLRGVQGGLRAAREAGVDVPGDFAMVAVGRGNGDEDYFEPPITTVDPQPEIELDIAFQCIVNPQFVKERYRAVPPVLSSRASTRERRSRGLDRTR